MLIIMRLTYCNDFLCFYFFDAALYSYIFFFSVSCCCPLLLLLLLYFQCGINKAQYTTVILQKTSHVQVACMNMSWLVALMCLVSKKKKQQRAIKMLVCIFKPVRVKPCDVNGYPNLV